MLLSCADSNRPLMGRDVSLTDTRYSIFPLRTVIEARGSVNAPLPRFRVEVAAGPSGSA